jgi:hypothetical protein
VVFRVVLLLVCRNKNAIAIEVQIFKNKTEHGNKASACIMCTRKSVVSSAVAKQCTSLSLFVLDGAP